MNDFIMLPRSMLSPDLWRNNGVCLRVYIHLLAHSIDGIASTSTAQIARATKLSVRQVRDALAELERSRRTTSKTTNKGTNITLCGIGGCDTPTTSKRTRRTTSKTTNTQEAPAPSAGYISPPYVAPEYADIWRKFIEYRKEIRKPYKSEASARTAYNKMVEMAGNDPAAAKDMVERTILGQWQGLYPNKNNATATSSASSAASRKEQRDRGRFLAHEIVSRSPDLYNLYNGEGTDPLPGED